MLAPPFKAWVAGPNPAALTIVSGGPVGRFHIAFSASERSSAKLFLTMSPGEGI